LENSKTDFENLDMLYKNSSCKCDSLVCENYESLEKKVHYLVKTVDKLLKGKSNFKNVLASQNCVFGKVGLGFNPQSKQDKFSKSFSKLPEKQPIEKSKQPVVTCFYCMKGGHSVRFCKIRKYSVPKGILGSLNKILSVEENFIIQSTPFGWLIVLDGNLKLSRYLLRELCSRWVERSHGFVVSSRVVPFTLLDVCLGIGLRVVGDKLNLEKTENNCKSRSFFKSSHVSVKMIYDEIFKCRNECSIDIRNVRVFISK